MTNSEENQYLFKEKILEGKGEIKAIAEIKHLRNSLKDYRILWSKYQSLVKENARLEKELKLNKNKKFKESFRTITTNTNKIYGGDIAHMRRIINHMPINKRITLKNLAAELSMAPDNLRSILEFLNEYKILEIKFPQEGGAIRLK